MQKMMAHATPAAAPVVDTMVPADFYVNSADPPAEFHGNPYDAVSGNAESETWKHRN